VSYRLNCLVLGDDPNNIFDIEIALTKDIDALKDLIKENKRPGFDAIAAKSLKLWDVSCLTPGLRSNSNDLILWKVDFPVDDTLERSIGRFDKDKQPLSAATKLLKVFSKLPQEEHLHIVIQRPPAGTPSVTMTTLSSILIDHPTSSSRTRQQFWRPSDSKTV
jgi:hypothetical protein